jgi:very-short-patch-repair endonuclease
MRGKGAEIVIHGFARRQGGVVARAQLLQAGLAPGVIERRVDAGLLHTLHRGVYAVGYREVAREGRWFAAMLASGTEAAVSHADALASWRTGRMTSGPVSVTVPGSSGRRRRGGLVVHRAPLPAGDVVLRDGLRVTSPARTLLDLAAILERRDLERALDEAHYLNRVSPRTLAETLERNRGRPGAVPLRALLHTHELGSTRTETALEETFLRAIRHAGLPTPRCQQWIGRHRVDFLWPAERLIVETDGWAAHRGRTRQARDADRDAELDRRGYEVTRIDEAEVAERLGAAVSRVAGRLSRSGPSA